MHAALCSAHLPVIDCTPPQVGHFLVRLPAESPQYHAFVDAVLGFATKADAIYMERQMYVM